MKLYKFWNNEEELYIGELYDAGKAGYKMKGCDLWFANKKEVKLDELLSELEEYMLLYTENGEFNVQNKCNNLFSISAICTMLHEIVSTAPSNDIRKSLIEAVNHSLGDLPV